MTNNWMLTALPAFPALTTIGGRLVVYNNNALPGLAAFDNLESIGSDLSFEEQDVLTDLSGFGKLQSVGGDFSISYNPVLPLIDDFPMLTTVGGDFSVSHNDSLHTLQQLSGLTQVGGDFTLVDIKGIAQIDPHSIDDLLIAANNSLSDCAVLSICQYLDLPNSSATFSSNETGCDSRDEVEAGCLSVSTTEPAAGRLRIGPNPVAQTLYLFWEKPAPGALQVFDPRGRLLRSLTVRPNHNEVDVSGWAPGVYLLKPAGVDEKIRVVKM